jgi:hypothetical protein
MCGAQTSWQVRICATPFTVARHSMQMPMPHSGARGSPCTEKRHGSLAIMMAAATLVPAATDTAMPFTVIEKVSFNCGKLQVRAANFHQIFHRCEFRRRRFPG